MFALKTIENNIEKFSTVPFLEVDNSLHQIISDLYFSIKLDINLDHNFNIYLITIENKKKYMLFRDHKNFLVYNIRLKKDDLNNDIQKISFKNNYENKEFKLSFNLYKINQKEILLTLPLLEIV